MSVYLRRRRSVWRLALGIFALAQLVATTCLLRLSTLRPPFGTVVFGSGTVWRGHTACFRVVALDPEDGSPVAFQSASVALRDARGARPAIWTSEGPLGQTVVDVPSDLDEDAWLDVRVQRPEAQDAFSLPLQVSDAATLPDGTLPSWRTLLRPEVRMPSGDMEVALYPESGQLVGGLENRLWGVLRRDGKPLRAGIRVEPLGLRTASDAAGVFTFTYRPAAEAPLLRFVPDRGTPVTLSLQAKPSQLLLRAHPATVLAPGEPLEVHLDALPFRGPIFVDLWYGRFFLASAQVAPSHGVAELRLVAPLGARGFVHVVAYRNPLNPDDTASSALRWVGDADDDTAPMQALAKLTGMDVWPPGEAAALRLAMSRFVPQAVRPPQLFSSTEGRRRAFEAARLAARERIALYVTLSLALGGLLGIAAVVLHRRQLARDVGDVVDEARRAGEPIDPQLPHTVGAVSSRVYLLLTLVSLGVAAYGLYELLGRIRWGRY